LFGLNCSAEGLIENYSW